MFYLYSVIIISFLLAPMHFVGQPEYVLKNDLKNNKQQEWSNETVKEIPILVYHYISEIPKNISKSNQDYFVTPEVFELQMNYLKNEHYQTLTFRDLYQITEGNSILPEKPVILTFDDGRESQYTQVFPILKKYNFKGVFNVFTNAIDREGYLTWDQLKELQENGMEIGNHSRFHWYLTKQPQDILEKEVLESKKLLEEKLETEIYTFAYPFGLYNQQVIEMVDRSGYKFARSLHHTKEISLPHKYTLGGFIVLNSPSYFEKILSTMY